MVSKSFVMMSSIADFTGDVNTVMQSTFTDLRKLRETQYFQFDCVFLSIHERV